MDNGKRRIAFRDPGLRRRIDATTAKDQAFSERNDRRFGVNKFARALDADASLLY